MNGKNVQLSTLGNLFLVSLLFCFVLVAENASAQIVLPSTGIINTVAGDGGKGDTGDGGSATNASIYVALGVAVDGAGNIYIADGGSTGVLNGHRVRKVTASTGGISTVAGSNNYGYAGDGGPATSAWMRGTWGVAVDGAGNIYIADNGNCRVRKVTVSTGIITTVAGNGTMGTSGDGGPATSASLCPMGIALDNAANIYIADGSDMRIRKVTAATGIISTVAGNGPINSGNGAYSGDGGPAVSADLGCPYGVAVDSSDNVYIADTCNNRIREVTASTGIINTIAGNGTAGYTGDGYAATIAELNGPFEVSVDGTGHIYIADTQNNRIRIVTASTGIITTYAGDGTKGYSGDGLAANDAELYWPEAVGTDSLGNVYIADTSNYRIRAVGGYLTSVLYPAYQVTSIIYAPPGNKSSAGFTDTTTNGTTTTLGSSFADSNTITFTEGFSFLGFGGSVSQSFGTSATLTNSNAFTETFSDATGVTNQSNSGNPNAINHNEDLFLIWLNPQITVEQNGSTPVSYSMGIQGSVLPDILEIFANTMVPNASGFTTVPATWLNHQTDPATGLQTPGLAAICANVIQAEYAANICTLADQCGCVPSDFAPILALDPLLGYSGTTSPLNANISSATNCGSLPIAVSGSNCRYVPVPSSPGSNLQEVQTLSGPESQGGNNNCNPFTQQENTSTTQIYGGTVGESTGFSFKAGSPGFSVTNANTLTWTQSQSTGTASGSGSSQTVNLCSATVGCGEDIAIYEDTIFHTFVFQQPAGNNSCP
jgi:hypothetical protein